MSLRQSTLLLSLALTLGLAGLHTGCDTADAKGEVTKAESGKTSKKKRAKKKKAKKKKAKKSSKKKAGTKKSSRSKASKDKKSDKSAPKVEDVVAEEVEDRTAPAQEDSAEGNEETPSAEQGGPGAEPQSEEDKRREAEQDRRDGRDPIPQKRPDTTAVNSLGSVLKNAKSLLVVEHDIPFRVLKFSNSSFSITDPGTIQSFIEAAGPNTSPMGECTRCVTTFTVTAKDAGGQDLAHLEMYCGGAVSTALINNTFTEQCWTVKDGDRMKSLLETASR